MKPLLILLICLPLGLAAQQDTSGQHRLIKGLVSYRNELIARNPDGFKKLYLLDTLWKLEAKEDVQSLLLAASCAKITEGYTAQFMANMIKIFSGIYKGEEMAFLNVINEELLQTIMDNDELALLIGQEIYKPKPPFVLNPDNSIYEELSFYKIKNGMRIAEIGAGDGTFSLLVGIAYDSLEIYLNEIAQQALVTSSERIGNCNSIHPSNQYQMVLGSVKSTNFETSYFDKILIRNSFHHFSKKNKMVASIKKSLSPNSELILFEPIKIKGNNNVCHEALAQDELRGYLVENGLQIIEEKYLEKWDWVLIRCKLAASN